MRKTIVLLIVLGFCFGTFRAEAGFKWPEIEVKVSEDRFNSVLDMALKRNKTFKLNVKMHPDTGYIDLFGKVKVNFEKLLDITHDAPFAGTGRYRDGIPFKLSLKPRVLKYGSLAITFGKLSIFDQEDKIEIRDFSVFCNIIGLLILETRLGKFIQNRVRKIKPIRVGEGTKQVQINFEKMGIRKDIRFVGSSVMIKVRPGTLVRSPMLNVIKMRDPRTWFMGVFFDMKRKKKYLYLSVGNGRPSWRYRKEMQKQESRSRKYFERRAK